MRQESARSEGSAAIKSVSSPTGNPGSSPACEDTGADLSISLPARRKILTELAGETAQTGAPPKSGSLEAEPSPPEPRFLTRLWIAVQDLFAVGQGQRLKSDAHELLEDHLREAREQSAILTELRDRIETLLEAAPALESSGSADELAVIVARDSYGLMALLQHSLQTGLDKLSEELRSTSVWSASKLGKLADRLRNPDFVLTVPDDPILPIGKTTIDLSRVLTRLEMAPGETRSREQLSGEFRKLSARIDEQFDSLAMHRTQQMKIEEEAKLLLTRLKEAHARLKISSGTSEIFSLPTFREEIFPALTRKSEALIRSARTQPMEHNAALMDLVSTMRSLAPTVEQAARWRESTLALLQRAGKVEENCHEQRAPLKLDRYFVELLEDSRELDLEVFHIGRGGSPEALANRAGLINSHITRTDTRLSSVETVVLPIIRHADSELARETELRAKAAALLGLAPDKVLIESPNIAMLRQSCRTALAALVEQTLTAQPVERTLKDSCVHTTADLKGGLALYEQAVKVLSRRPGIASSLSLLEDSLPGTAERGAVTDKRFTPGAVTAARELLSLSDSLSTERSLAEHCEAAASAAARARELWPGLDVSWAEGMVLAASAKLGQIEQLVNNAAATQNAVGSISDKLESELQANQTALETFARWLADVDATNPTQNRLISQSTLDSLGSFREKLEAIRREHELARPNPLAVSESVRSLSDHHSQLRARLERDPNLHMQLREELGRCSARSRQLEQIIAQYENSGLAKPAGVAEAIGHSPIRAKRIAELAVAAQQPHGEWDELIVEVSSHTRAAEKESDEIRDTMRLAADAKSALTKARSLASSARSSWYALDGYPGYSPQSSWSSFDLAYSRGDFATALQQARSAERRARQEIDRAEREKERREEEERRRRRRQEEEEAARRRRRRRRLYGY